MRVTISVTSLTLKCKLLHKKKKKKVSILQKKELTHITLASQCYLAIGGDDCLELSSIGIERGRRGTRNCIVQRRRVHEMHLYDLDVSYSLFNHGQEIFTLRFGHVSEMSCFLVFLRNLTFQSCFLVCLSFLVCLRNRTFQSCFLVRLSLVCLSLVCLRNRTLQTRPNPNR